MALIERAADLAMVGANGGGWTVNKGVAAPMAPTGIATPTTPFLPLGGISDDGLVYGFDEDSQEFTPWGLASPWRTQITKSVRTFKVVLWETNRSICKSVMFRLDVDDLTPDVDSLVTFAESGSPVPDRRAWVFDVMDGDTVQRFFVPEGEVTDRSDVTFKPDEMAGYEITISAYPDDAGNTCYHTYKVTVPVGGGDS